MNRGILVQREVPDKEELIESARYTCYCKIMLCTQNEVIINIIIIIIINIIIIIIPNLIGMYPVVTFLFHVF